MSKAILTRRPERIGILVFIICLIPLGASGAPLFVDNFNDNFLDPNNWTPLAAGGPSIQETNSRLARQTRSLRVSSITAILPVFHPFRRRGGMAGGGVFFVPHSMLADYSTVGPISTRQSQGWGGNLSPAGSPLILRSD